MRHFLAYGNSDQASFRQPDVREAFDFLLVPGTIAAYYADATAAFVLSSQLDYVIEPRTPLFQGRIPEPKASHYSLAERLGATVRTRMGEDNVRAEVNFARNVYTPPVIRELVDSVISFQRGYGGRAPEIEGRLTRYRQLLAEALQRPALEDGEPAARPPSFILAPYFAVESLADPWWDVCLAIWDVCTQLEAPARISPVVAVASPGVLSRALVATPGDLSPTCFFWITGFDERTAPERELATLWEAVSENSSRRSLVNLYGSFFSVCLEYARLWGFNNGLGYSESRSWPELPSTGAAPPRYYLPNLHLFLPPAVAQLITDADPFFRCPCAVCITERYGRPVSIVSLSYHELKRHFVLARQGEIELVTSSSQSDVAAHLHAAAERFGQLRESLPARVRIEVAFLRRWARVLEGGAGASRSP